MYKGRKMIPELVLGVAWEPTSGWKVASHSDVVIDIHFEMAAILHFHLQG